MRFRWLRMLSMRRRVESSGRGCVPIMARSWIGCTGCAARCGWPMRRARRGLGSRGRWPTPQIDCVVAAPSKLIRPAGDRVKTDARDAAHLTRLLRLGEITAVTVPEADVEAVRDLVRAREDARADSDAGSAPVVQAAAAPGPGVLGRAGLERGARDLAASATFRRFPHRGGLRSPLRCGAHRDRGSGSSRRADRRGRGLTAVGRPGRPVGVSARDLGADRFGVVGGDRRLDPVHRVLDRRLRRSGSHGVLLGGTHGCRARSPKPATPTCAGC